jgi:hypothetical protein
MSYLPELRASLVRAAAAESARHRTAAPPPRRRRLGWLGPAIAAGVTVAVVAVALVLIGHTRHAASPTGHAGPAAKAVVPTAPQQPNLSSAQWSLIERARNAATRSDPACWPYRKLPAELQGPPSRALTSILGVLRRPATPVDALPDDLLSHGVPAGIYVNSIRRALDENGVALYIVPTAGLAFRTVPVRCAAKEHAALVHEARGLARRQVRADLAMQRSYLIWQQYLARHPGAVCVATVSFQRVGRTLGGGSVECGATAAQIEQGTQVGGETSAHETVLSGIVPDGVAMVTLEFRRPPGAARARVLNNGYVVELPRTSAEPSQILWLSAAGRVIKTIRLP